MESTADSRSRRRNSRLGWVIGVVAVTYLLATVIFLVVTEPHEDDLGQKQRIDGKHGWQERPQRGS